MLVKWWLLALPHYLIVGILIGGSLGWANSNDERFAPVAGGLLGVLVLITGVVLLFSGRYPRPLFDLIVGLNRWIYRVIAYAALMTDRYPPFRLDQGGSETTPDGPWPPPDAPSDAHGVEPEHRELAR